METQSDMFESVRGMVHRGDPLTSVDAALVIARKATELHEQVVGAVRELGPMTDEQLERLPRFESFGPSTVRKRRSELFQAGILENVGTRLNSRGRKMVIWGLAGRVS